MDPRLRGEDRNEELYMSIESQKNEASLAKDLQFLGPEFLTWLFFYISNEGSEVDLAELCPKHPHLNGVVRLVIGNNVVLVPPDVASCRVQVSDPVIESSGEVLQAICGGSQVDSLAIEMIMGERVYSMVLHAKDAAITQVKFRDLFEVSDKDGLLDDDVAAQSHDAGRDGFKDEALMQEEALILRMSVLDESEDILRGLYSKFLTRRLAQAFVAEDILHIRQLVSDGLREKLPEVGGARASTAKMGAENPSEIQA